MSKNLTDADQYDSPITVPVGTDSRDDAAGDVELIAQRLANRTHHLNTHAAKKDQANTFTANQTINGELTVRDKMIVPVIDSSAAQLTIDDPLVCNFSATVNGTFRVQGGSTSFVENLIASKYIYVQGATNYVLVDGNVQAAEFKYASPPERTMQVPLYTAGAASAEGSTALVQPDKFTRAGLPLPSGARLKSVRVKLALTAGSNFDGVNYKVVVTRTKVDLGADWAGADEFLSFNKVEAHAQNRDRVVEIACNSDNIDHSGTASEDDIDAVGALALNDKYQFYVKIYNDGPTTADMYVKGIDMTFIDPGPRNH